MAGHPPAIPCAAGRAPLPWGSRVCNNCGSSQPAAPAPAPAPQPPPPAAKPNFGAMTVIGVASPIANLPLPPPQQAPPPQQPPPQQPAPLTPQEEAKFA